MCSSDLQKFELVRRNTAEIIGEEELKKLLSEKKKPIELLMEMCDIIIDKTKTIKKQIKYSKE